MMRNRITAALCAITMVFGAGCGTEKKKAEETAQTIKGGYVEEDAFDFNISDSASGAKAIYLPHIGEMSVINGKVCFPDQVSLRFFTEKEDLSGYDTEEKASPVSGELNCVCRSVGGRIFAVAENLEKISETEYKVASEEAFFISPDGNRTDLDYSSDSEFNSMSYEFGSDEKLYFADSLSGKLLRADPDTGKTEEVCDIRPSNTNVDIAGKYVIVSSNSENIDIYDTEAGEMADEQPVLQEFWDKTVTPSAKQSYDICEGEDGTIYIACQKGIFRYAFGGNTVEQLCSGAGKKLSEPSEVFDENDICSVVKESDDTILVGYRNSVIKRYRYDPDYEETIAAELKVYSFEYNQIVTRVMNKFSKEHPEILIDQEMPDASLDYDDKVKNLITEIMSDDPPDVLMLDGLDIKNLSDKNVLADLAECRDEWYPEGEGLFDNVALWNTDESGKIYSVAGGFTIPYILSDGSEDISGIETYKDLADYTGRRVNDEKDRMLFVPAEYMASAEISWKAFMFDAYDMLNSGSNDKDELKSLLESCSNLTAEADVLEERYPDEDIAALQERSSQCARGLFPDDKKYEGRYATNADGMYLRMGTSPIEMGFVFNYQYDFISLMSAKSDIENAQLRLGGISGEAFVPTVNMGICSRAKNTEEARLFIAAALSKEPQSGLTADGIPVNIEALRNDLEKDKESGTPTTLLNAANINFSDGSSVWIDYTVPTDEDLELLINSAKKLEKPIVYDSMTFDTVTNAIIEYLFDNISADEAAEKIISRENIKSKE